MKGLRRMASGGRWAARCLGGGTGHLLWPQLCLNCKDPIPLSLGRLCQSCWNDVLACTAGDYCPTCGRDVSPYALYHNQCPQCLNERFHFEGLLRCGIYDLAFRNMILAFKNGRTEMDALLGPMARSTFHGHRLSDEINVLVPVPLHWTRHLTRGYNQAHVLARVMRVPGIPICSVLKRARRTLPQPVAGGVGARRRNVKGAFAVRSAAHVQGKRVCLIDDIKTTGATLSECARVLRQAGAGRVIAMVLAVAGQRPAG